jgi:hypothetical protein
VLIDASAGDITYTLLPAAQMSTLLFVNRVDSSGHVVHIASPAGETFQGAASPYTLATSHAVVLASDGANYFVLAVH